MKFAPAVALFVPLAFSLGACSPESSGGASSGGRSGSGGSQTGTGGSASGGQSGSGGSGSGGSGGSASGGSSSGGSSASGGSNGTGGASTGGAGTDGGAGSGGALGLDGGASGGSGQNSDGGTAAGGGGGGGRGGSGGGSGGGAGGNGGASTFNPCPASGTDCKIMPFGDSITFGANSSGGGYRVELFKQGLMNSKKITFVGRESNGPNSVVVNGVTTTFPKGHEGYRGYTIDTNTAANRTGISSLADAALNAAKPHIVLLMIGTNDVNNDLDLANAPTRLGNLLDRITTAAPNALLVVAKLTPTQTDTKNTKVRTYNDAIPGLVSTRVAAGKHIIVVDMYAAITANASYKTAWLDDDLHPNDAGYVVMGQTWYAGIKSYLP